MKNSLIAIVALALLAAPVFADYSAYFSQNSAAFSINAEETGFPGHFGNYSVSVHVFPRPSYVEVYGEGASQPALASEIGWMEQNGMLNASCNGSAILALSYNDYYCAPAGEWEDCAQAAECIRAPVPEQPPEPVQLPEVMGIAQNAVQASASANAVQAPAATGGAGGAEGAPSQGMDAGQLIPLLGAFLAVIVLSYLVLQQRQIQVQIDPQEERLLSNGTRAGIMQELSLADKIPTDLSSRLGKSKATIVEHLGALSEAGFIERIETPGRKFVFYRLTRKGKQAMLRRAG